MLHRGRNNTVRYVIDYSVASFLYLGVIVWFYLRQKQVPNLRSQIFRGMLLAGFATGFLDIASVLMEKNAGVYPIWMLWLVNFVLLVMVQIGPFLFFIYTVVITNHWNQKTKLKSVLVVLPVFFALILLCCSAFSKFGAFYIASNHVYYKGATHILLYAVAGVYILLSTRLVVQSRKNIHKKKQRVIYAFIGITVITMLIQCVHPQYLLNSTANALALLMMYCALELPSNHVDTLTGAFNRAGATILLEDLYLRHQPFCIQMVSMKSFKTINQQFGSKVGDAVFQKSYEYLHDIDPDCNIFRCYGDVFGIIRVNESMNTESLQEAALRFPTVLDIGDTRVCVSVKMACINSEHCVNTAAVFATLDYIMEEFHQTESQNVLLADHEFYNRCMEKSKVEHALERAIAQNSIVVHYQPIHRSAQKVETLEALARVYDEAVGFVSPDVFTRIAEQNGSIIKLGEQVLHKVCQFVAENGSILKEISYVSVNLSVVQCMKENLSNEFLEIVRAYDIDPQQICFEITETTSVDSFELVRKTMNEFTQKGFRFSLDDFGTGYANFQYLSELPFTNVKIDKSLLWAAMNHSKQRKLLSGISGIIHNMNLNVICEGVETEEQIALLNGMGVELHQGFYYSKALAEEELLAYLRHLPTRRNVS